MTGRLDAKVFTHPFGGWDGGDAPAPWAPEHRTVDHQTLVNEPLTHTDLEELCTRRLDHARFQRLFIEATYAKTRSNGVVAFETIVGLIGQQVGGTFEVLGFDVGDSEDRDFWSRILFVLRLRGLRGLREVVTEDDHSGLAEAVRTVYPGAELTVRRPSDTGDAASEIAGRDPHRDSGGVRSRRAHTAPDC